MKYLPFISIWISNLPSYCWLKPKLKNREYSSLFYDQWHHTLWNFFVICFTHLKLIFVFFFIIRLKDISTCSLSYLFQIWSIWKGLNGFFSSSTYLEAVSNNFNIFFKDRHNFVILLLFFYRLILYFCWAFLLKILY